jgi:hypothetical protein
MLPSEVQRRPTLLNSCAMAATAAEARYRIGYEFLPRDSRIIAVDEAARELVCRASRWGWTGVAHFLLFEALTPDGGNGTAPDARLRGCDGSESTLSAELADADVAVLVAGSQGAEAASVIGRVCAARRVMTAGVVVAGEGERVNDAVLALRPHAMVLVVSSDEEDLLDLLTALRV